MKLMGACLGERGGHTARYRPLYQYVCLLAIDIFQIYVVVSAHFGVRVFCREHLPRLLTCSILLSPQTPGALFLCLVFMGYSNLSGTLPIVTNARVVFYREKAANMYCVKAFALANVCHSAQMTYSYLCWIYSLASPYVLPVAHGLNPVSLPPHCRLWSRSLTSPFKLSSTPS